MVFRIPFPETQVVGHDVSDEPFVEEAAQVLNALFRPWFSVAEKIRDMGAELFMQFEMLFECGVAAIFHQRLLVGKVYDDVVEQIFIGTCSDW